MKPLDVDLICFLARQCRYIITVEENILAGGFGSAVLECLEQNGIGGINAKRLGIPDEFVEHGSQETLRDKYGLNEQGIYASVKEFLAAHNPKKGLPKFVKIK